MIEKKDKAGTYMLKNKEKDKAGREQTEIIEELETIKNRIDANETMFNLASDEEIIDAMIYEQKSLHSRYAYLLKVAKEKGIKINFTDRL